MDKKNVIKVYTTSNGAELNISAPSTKQLVSATNNRAQYFAEQAKKYRDEAKLHRDNAKYYAEQNSDVTFEYIDKVSAVLDAKISEKQDSGDYALREELPINVSELENDAEYISKTEFNTTVDEIKLPSQEGCEGRFLTTDGENESWVGITSFQLFDTVLKDHVLTYEESQGLALQGTYVYKEAIAGSRYGYPDFYNKVVEEFNEATSTETVNGVEIKVHSNGHKFYDISNKDSIDSFFNSMGYAWFYGVDTENERVFLPRNNWFEQATALESEVGKGIEAGLPNITGNLYDSPNAGADGAFTRSALGIARAQANNSSGASFFTNTSFKASLSNSIYGKSNTVQPKSVKKLLYICVGNTTNYTGMTDVVNQGMEILEQVSQKVNVDGTNLNPEGRSLLSSYAFPSGKAINITAGASESTYTAPANGWYQVAIQQTTSGNCQLNLYTGGINLYHVHSGAQNGAWKSLYVPVKKGSEMILQYSGGSIVEFRFIYAEGEG